MPTTPVTDWGDAFMTSVMAAMMETCEGLAA